MRVSVDSAGNQANNGSLAPAISANGRFVAFGSLADNLVPGDTKGQTDIFVHDRKTGATTRVSVGSAGNQGNNGSGGSAITANGRYVAFSSDADNLVPGDTNGETDAFVHDRRTGATERVSIDSAGDQANLPSYSTAISANGRFVAFWSDANNLVPGDTNGQTDAFVHDRKTGE
jgi:Tol biopolymer transport system component